MARVFDLTHPLGPRTDVFPGDPRVRFRPHADYAREGYRVTHVELGTHAGTHLDAPAHVVPGGLTVDRIPLETLVGPARVLGPALPAEPIAAGERVLVRSGWSVHWTAADYFRDFPPLPAPLVEALAAAPAALVGLDTPSLHPDREEDRRLHRTLLRAGVVIVENLANLELLPPQVFLIVLPLPLRELDGAPCRAIAMDLPGPVRGESE